MRRAAWWLPEKRRAYGSVLAGIVLTLPLLLPTAVDFSQSSYALYAFVLLAAYLSTYVLLTLVVFSRAPAPASRAWARETQPGTRVERFVLGTQPGTGMATGLSGISLAAVLLGRSTELWGDMGLNPVAGTFVVAALLVSSWLALGMTYAVEYMCRDQREDRESLRFSGDDEPVWSDYLYFSLGVSTTFGTHDVAVRNAAMRRTVTGHGLMAFVFNTIIIVIAISALV